MGMDSRNEDPSLPPLAKQKFQELVAVMAEIGFGPGGPSRDTDFATIEQFGHQAVRMLGRAIDVHPVSSPAMGRGMLARSYATSEQSYELASICSKIALAAERVL